MYFVLVKEIETGKIIDKAEISSTGNIGGELAHIASLTKRQLENRYPSDKYYVTFEAAESWQSLQNKLKSTSSIDEEVFTMCGSRYNLFLINIGAMVGGTILLFLLLAVRLIYNPFIFILGVIILFLYLYIDIKRWMKKGIHTVKIDKNGFTVYRGIKNSPSRIGKEQITAINVFKKLNRKIVNILLGGYADTSLPGITFFSGPRIRITDDAFNQAEFAIFINKLKELRPELTIQL